MRTSREVMAQPYVGGRQHDVAGLTAVCAYVSAEVADGEATSAKALGTRNKGLS